MNQRLTRLLSEVPGAGAVEPGPAGMATVAPSTTEAVSGVLRIASEEGWRVRLTGSGSFAHDDAPADLRLTTARLNQVLRVAAEDLVVTVQPAVTLPGLSRELEAAGLWLPWDPPGGRGRSLGGIVATGTAGPLRHGPGAIRDAVLGCTVVAGDGRVLKPGGAVVKNVAGYDLTRLQVGAFGAFGVVTSLHLRVRARPAADRTWRLGGSRDHLTAVARDLSSEGLDAAALELLSPAVTATPDWTLAARLTGPEDGVLSEATRLTSAEDWTELDRPRATAMWQTAAMTMCRAPVTLRLGVLPEGLDELLDLLAERLDLGVVAASPGTGALRWAGDATAAQVREIRHLVAAREVPLTLERAPWPVLQATGHFGAYREGVGPLVSRLRTIFDPKGTLVTAVAEAADV